MNVPQTQTTVSKVVLILLEALSAHASLDTNLTMTKGLVLVSACSFPYKCTRALIYDINILRNW